MVFQKGIAHGMAKILLVEDDDTLATLVREELTQFGHDVLWVADGACVEAQINADIALVLLDVMLPHVNGIELCKRIRSRSQVPIIMLTARSSEADRVAGLELGADDYLVKPFSLRELIARCHAQLRRAGWQQPAHAARPFTKEASSARYFDCDLDRAAMQVSVAGQNILLSTKEFELLCVLVDTPGRALTREWLLDRVWGRDYDGSDRTVDNHVLKLREKLGRDSAISNAISAIRGIGYRMEKT
jgi:two-component system, OmpR family, alkaline phosphatase synthesis response regulator PhoP